VIKRIISAVILIPIAVYLILFADILYMKIAIIAVGGLSYKEWIEMDSQKINIIRFIYFALYFLFAISIVFFTQMALYCLFFIFIVHMIVNFTKLEKEYFMFNSFMFSGIIYVSLYFFAIFLSNMENGRIILMMLLVSIWTGDSFAYFCGKKIGKHKLSKFISPKKTYEGAVCGVVFGSLSAVVFAYFLHNFNLIFAFYIGFIANITGIFGDLAESVVKRVFNKKDSSNLIPGHGGMLDRLDSASFAVFFVYLFMLWKVL